MNLNSVTILVRTLCPFFFLVSVFLAGRIVCAGQDDTAVSGKVILYEPDKRIVIETSSNGAKEFTISAKTILQDVFGNRTTELDLKKDFPVRIQIKENGEAMNIRPTPDVGGPDYNPTPKPNR